MQHNFDEIIDRRGTNSSKWLKYPKDVLPMWVADSDFKCPQPVVDKMIALATHGIYAYPWVDEGGFEKAACAWMKKRFNWHVEPDCVEFSPSVGTSLAVAVKAFTDKGDNVLIQTPIYPPFPAVIKYNNRKDVRNELVWRDNAWHIDFDDFEKKCTDPRTKLFLLCNPHNPSGRVFTREELTRMGDICLKHNVYVFSDEIHCDYVFKGHTHIPFPTLKPEYKRICVVGINPSKTFNIAGLRTSAVLYADKEIQQKFHETLASCKLGRNVFGLLGFETAYNECDYYADQVRDYVEKNLEYAVKYISENIPQIKTYKPESTYLMWLDCRGLGFAAQEELEKFCLEKAKVGMNTGTSFGEQGKGFMRLNVACPLSVVKEGLSRIEKACKALA